MLSRLTTNAAQRFREFACYCAVFGSTVIAQQAALAQGAPLVCVITVEADTGPVHAIGDLSTGRMLIGAAKGLFVARTAGGKVTVTPVRGDGDTGRVLSVHGLPGGRALIGGEKGLFLAREAGGTVTLAPVPGDAGNGPVNALHDLPGAGVLVGTEKGLFLAREAAGKVTVVPTGYPGQVLEMDDFVGRGVLLRTGAGWILARAASGKVTLMQSGGSGGHVRSMQSYAGGVLVEGRDAWLMLREERGKLTGALFADDVAGLVDAVGHLPRGLMLLHGDKGWFTARTAGSKITFAPAGGPDTRRVLHMTGIGSGLLAQTWDGWFLALEAGGKVTFTRIAVDREIGEVFRMHPLTADSVLIGAEWGLFLAREAGGKVTLERIGETGPVLIMRHFAGGILIGAAAGWFVAREVGGKFTVTPAGPIAIGNVVLNARNPGYQMRDLPGGAVLIGAERGVFVAAPPPAGARACEGR